MPLDTQGNRVSAVRFNGCMRWPLGRVFLLRLGNHGSRAKGVEPMAVSFVERIENHFEKVTDPRVHRGTDDPLIEMVFVALCGAITPGGDRRV